MLLKVAHPVSQLNLSTAVNVWGMWNVQYITCTLYIKLEPSTVLVCASKR